VKTLFIYEVVFFLLSLKYIVEVKRRRKKNRYEVEEKEINKKVFGDIFFFFIVLLCVCARVVCFCFFIDDYKSLP